MLRRCPDNTLKMLVAMLIVNGPLVVVAIDQIIKLQVRKVTIIDPPVLKTAMLLLEMICLLLLAMVAVKLLAEMAVGLLVVMFIVLVVLLVVMVIPMAIETIITPNLLVVRISITSLLVVMLVMVVALLVIMVVVGRISLVSSQSPCR